MSAYFPTLIDSERDTKVVPSDDFKRGNIC